MVYSENTAGAPFNTSIIGIPLNDVIKVASQFLALSLGDLGGVPGARPAKGPDFSKFSKRNRLGSRRPPMRSTSPLWEILDPPLLMKI